MGIQDNFWTIGKEAVAYGTAAATLTRGIRNQVDDHKAVVEAMVDRGMKKGSVSTPLEDYVAQIRGGKGTVDLTLINKSIGMLLEGASSTYVITTPDGATNARLHTATPTAAGPSTSYSVHVTRYAMSGTGHPFTYVGGMVETLKLIQEPKAFAKIQAMMDYAGVLDANTDPAASSPTPAYPESVERFSDAGFSLEIDEVEVCQRKVEFTLPTGVDVDRWRVGCGTNGRKSKPVTKARVAPSGVLEMDYADNAFYDKYKTGDPVEIVATWTGTEIETGFDYFLKLTMPNCVFTGDTPQVSLDNLPGQPLPFEMLDGGTSAPPWKIEWQTTDTAV